MGDKPPGSDVADEFTRDDKHDLTIQRDVVNWMGEVTGDKLTASGSHQLQEALKDGVYLCLLINCLFPGTVRKINHSPLASKQRENIDNFLSGCENVGVQRRDLFQTADLYGGDDMPQVVSGIYALARKAESVGKQGMGPIGGTENKRELPGKQLEDDPG
ncbi:myophilin-like [Convolutriloba macropyga]|uniref:myophilin-like n=1 Tax=Convolutriloba macropyga TaxID=536237 RepID=UPI003F52701D